MDETVLQEAFDELFSALETLETQNGAVLQWLKSRGLAEDEDLAPFLESAARASSVRWRAARIRMNHLLSKAPRKEEPSQEMPQAAKEVERDHPLIQQSSERRTDSKEPEKSKEKDQDSSRDEEKDESRRQSSDGDPKMKGNGTDKLADKETA